MLIKIENFQSLGKVEVQIEGLTVLVGKSNLGKSAFARALEAALFNRPGEDFIRTGTKEARVTVRELPSVAGAPLDVVWEKGHNLNRFMVNGVEFAKVGIAAPPPLPEAGYRDVKIGGDTIRPQVAGQFDPLFLLTRPGSFISDVLSVISRLAVLLHADRSCSRDAKTQRGLLAVRRGDLDTATAKLTTLQGIVELHGRVRALESLLVQARNSRALIAEVRGLVATRIRLLPTATMEVPEAVPVPADLGDRYRAAFELVARRQQFVLPEGLQLPPQTDPQMVAKAFQLAETRAVLGQLVQDRQRLVPVEAVALPAIYDYHAQTVKIEQWVAKAAMVRALKDARLKAATGVADAVRSAKSIRQEQERAEGELASVRAEMSVCPVCDRPMEVAHAGQQP